MTAPPLLDALTQREYFALHLMAAFTTRGLHGEWAADAAVRSADILINRLNQPNKNHVTANPILEIPNQNPQPPSTEPKTGCQRVASDRHPARISNVSDRARAKSPQPQLLNPPTRKRSVE